MSRPDSLVVMVVGNLAGPILSGVGDVIETRLW